MRDDIGRRSAPAFGSAWGGENVAGVRVQPGSQQPNRSCYKEIRRKLWGVAQAFAFAQKCRTGIPPWLLRRA